MFGAYTCNNHQPFPWLFLSRKGLDIAIIGREGLFAMGIVTPYNQDDVLKVVAAFNA